MQTNDKLNPRGVPCIFLGYPPHQKGYKLLNLLTNQTFVSRDVKFYEHIFPYLLSKKNLSQLIPPSPDHKITPSTTWEDSSDEDESPPPESDIITPSPPQASPVPHIRKSTRTHQPPT